MTPAHRHFKEAAPSPQGHERSPKRKCLQTDEREHLCDFIDQSLAEHNVDIVVLAARHGLGQYPITDKWREW
ncbi:hypothetical protein [Streptomyces canus]|uniref:hypothetical protein n=1 Tax=Streptomyces canus TaxID=58343 RepID=UPI0014289CFA|nr:hypothetical protein [Streptomyces canus]